jgi:hypothetical protein
VGVDHAGGVGCARSFAKTVEWCSEPGWRNWQTQRTVLSSTAIPTLKLAMRSNCAECLLLLNGNFHVIPSLCRKDRGLRAVASHSTSECLCAMIWFLILS